MVMARLMGKRNSSCMFMLTFAVLSSLSFFVLTSGNVSADEPAVDAVTITVPVSCSMTDNIVTGNEHTKLINAGTYEPNIGLTDVLVSCNDRDGFSVYAVGYSNNVVGNTNLIGSTSSLTIPTGTSTDTTVSNWALKLMPMSGVVAPTILSDSNGSYASYHVVPATAAKVITYIGDVNIPSAIGFQTTYAVATTLSQTADTYVGQVKYTLVHPNYSNADGTLESYPVNLTLATGVANVTVDGVSYAASTTLNLTYGTHTISASLSGGYEFEAWAATGNVTIADTSANPTTINVTGAGTLTLSSEIGKVYMQDLTATQCSTLASDGNFTVYDRRDESDYTVRYLQNACWMTQNLRLTNTVSSQYSNFSTNSTFNPCVGDLTAGNSYDEARCHDSGDNSKGVWYNYASASAGTITGTSNKTLATEDICPAGWHLPNYDTTKPAGSINSLIDLPIKRYFSSVTGGYYNGGNIDYTGSGYWWSSVADTPPGRYNLVYTGRTLTYGSHDRGSSGLYIRCVRSS